MSRVIETPRLVLRPWEPADIGSVTHIYTPPLVKRWLKPRAQEFDTPAALQSTFSRWCGESPTDVGCVGHWAVQTRDGSGVVGGISLEFAPPGGDSLTIAWVLEPDDWGYGYAVEAGDALIRWAIHEQGVVEVFAILQPDNLRAAATAERIGMEWVRELGHLSDGGRYQVYRIRHGDMAYHD